MQIYRNALLGLLQVACLIPELGFAQLPYLLDVEVEATVSSHQQNGIFEYGYLVRNGQTSQGAIRRFRVDISRTQNSVEYDTAGLQYAEQWTEVFIREDFVQLADSIVPVSSSAVPIYWTGLISRDLSMSFSNDSRADIQAGDSLSGFALQSKALPGIGGFLAEPGIDVYMYPDMDEVSDVDSLLEQMQADREVVRFVGKTVRPTAPATTFSALTFLDTIKSYINESRTLGWITTQGTATKYTALIDSSQANLSANPSRRGITKAKLDSILVNANVDSSTTLTSEAYALLRFNTEYVLNKLREYDTQLAAENQL